MKTIMFKMIEKRVCYCFYSLVGILLLAISSCAYNEKINTGELAMQRKQYFIATQLLEKEISNSRAEGAVALKAYQLGIAYDKIGDFKASAKWFETAVNANYGPESLYKLSHAYKKSGKYNEAMKLLNDYMKQTRDQVRLSSEIASTEQALNWVLEEKENRIYRITKLPVSESNTSEILSSVDKKGNLIYTSDKSLSGKGKYKWTGNSFFSVFEYDGDKSVMMEGVFASDMNVGTPAYSRDGNECIFIKCDVQEENDFYCKLYYTRKINESWTDPVLLNFTQPGVNYVHPAFNEDGGIIAFSSDDKNGPGGYSIYYSRRNGPLWDYPVIAGNNINSSSNEGFPQFKGDTLFFASDRSAGMGGFDIYYTYMLSDGRMSPPVNMKYPINSPADDFGLILLQGNEENNWQGYFTSNRDGSDDIFKFERDVLKENKILKEKKKAAMNYFVDLTIMTEEKEYNEPQDPLSGVKLRKPLAQVSIEIFENGEFLSRRNSSNFGFFDFKPEWDKDYTFVFNKSGYLANSIKFSTKDLAIDSTVERQKIDRKVLMEQIFLNKEIVLENIFYDFDKWDIRPDARPSLDTLTTLLRVNPSVSIELSSHTDCRGNAEYNIELSQKRAQSAVNYLIANGISASRLRAMGYGKNVPAAKCMCEACTEEEHQRNRRTSFMIIDGI